MSNLIVYSSKYGGTGKLAEILKNHLTQTTKIIKLDEKEDFDLKNYDNIFLGSSIYVGKARKNAIHFCEQNLNQLKHKNLGIFLSCWDDSKLEEYVANSFPSEIIDWAEIVYGGIIANPEQMSFLDKMIIKFVVKDSQPISNIKNQNLKKLAESIE